MQKRRQSRVTTSAERPKPIREDLWTAIMDYSSGRRYVWDAARGIARAAQPGDTQPYFHTVTVREVAEWRAEFLEIVERELDAKEAAAVGRWRRENLPTSTLPAHLQPRWNGELKRRVRRRLRDFFSSLERNKDMGPPGLPAASERDREGDITDEIAAARDAGDFFSVGELLATRLKSADPRATENLLTRVIAAWAAPKGPPLDATSPADLMAQLDSIPEENAAAALINALRRRNEKSNEVPDAFRDLAFRLRNTIAEIYGAEDKRSPSHICTAAMGRLDAALYDLESAVQRLLRTSPATAKAISVEVLKASHVVLPMLVPAEREFVRDLEVLIGPAFRKLCEAYERNDDAEVLRRAPEFVANVKSHTPATGEPRLRSSIWNKAVAPILHHVSELVAEAMSRGEIALAPSLRLRNGTTKADLRHSGREIFLSFALRNSGRGHAHDVSLQSGRGDLPLELTLTEPAAPFDVAPGGEQLIRLRLSLSTPASHVAVPISWLCQTSTGKEVSFSDEIVADQQVTEPNWDELISQPPYSLNPIKRPDRLYGRDAALQSLALAAMSGASKFVWGQKRIGKTSLLQVLVANLSERPDTTCVLLRMGEIASLHEGELARVIAQRLAGESPAVDVPLVSEFGAGLGRLVPFIETLAAKEPNRKFVVVIDEFDDLDPSFYTGERGKQFVKALRSLSEVGITFFFVGSERMEAIFHRHQADLNKWTNVKLDRIDSRAECAALITKPVAAALEFSPQAVNFVIDYCGGNPFYINNFCYQIFERCLQERRTFVDDNDTEAVRHQLLRALGPTNFAHFWEDNPLLDREERRKAIAENCIALICVSILGGRYEDQEDLLEAQDTLPLGAALRASDVELRHACERLVARGILSASPENDGYVITLRIFSEWLSENAVSKLLPIWTAYRETERTGARSEPLKEDAPEPASDISSFVIAEDDILAVSQRLVFVGRQKDVAELRSWLRQFDDEARIEVAFLLLRRLAERGFINEGAKSLALVKLEEIIRARRLEVGGGAWKIERGRLDNLCLTYVDSELKSGAATARELKNILRPVKSGSIAEIGAWMRTHQNDDPMVVVVDDFGGTGETLGKGIERFKAQTDRPLWKRYLDEGRLSAVVMFAFPEAVENIRKRCPGVHVVAATVLGEELRACSEEAGIFESDADLRFAKDILLQIGRELYPAAPLGFGDLGALVAFHNTVPNNTLPIFWSNGRVGDKPWRPIFPRP